MYDSLPSRSRNRAWCFHPQGFEFQQSSRVWLQLQTLKKLDNGAFFFMEGDPAERAFVLLGGKVKLGQVTVDGQQVILGYLVPGRVFGIIASLKKMTLSSFCSSCWELQDYLLGSRDP